MTRPSAPCSASSMARRQRRAARRSTRFATSTRSSTTSSASSSRICSTRAGIARGVVPKAAARTACEMMKNGRINLRTTTAAYRRNNPTMRVLLIDDDARLAELLVGYLQPQGVALVHAGGGQAGLAQLAAGGFDAILLDVMMPGLDGLAVLRKIRDAGHRVPVIMLTARGDEADRVVGLELGADDYVHKPFSPRELLARLRAVLRRAAPDTVAERLSAAGITVDTGAREAWVDGQPVELTGL